LPSFGLSLAVSLLLCVGVLAVLVFAGWAVAYGMGVRDGAAAIGFASTLGIALFVTFSNALGYALPIRCAFIVALLLVAAIGIVAFAMGLSKKRKTSTWSWPSKSLLLLIIAITLVTALAYVRDRGSDEWSWPHFALPVTIIEGNFPIVEPAMPWQPLEYHYGAPLFVAGLSSLTGISVALSQALIPLFCAIGILWFGLALGKKLSGSWGGGTLAAVMGYMAGGLFWLLGVFLARDLFKQLVLHVPTPNGNPFWWLTFTIRNLYAQGLMPMLGHRPTALGGVFLFGFLYVFHEALHEKSVKKLSILLAIAFTFALQLALSSETTFIMLPAALGLHLLLSLIDVVRKKGSASWKKLLICSAIVWIPALIVAGIQGGPLTSHTNIASDGAFIINWIPRMPIGTNVRTYLYLTDAVFWRDYGIHFVLLLAATVWVWRTRGFSSFLSFLCIVGGSHLALPFLITYTSSTASMQRLLTVGFAVGSFVIALFLWETALKPGLKTRYARCKRWSAIIVIIAVLLAAVLNAPIRLFFPSLRFESTPLLPPMPEQSIEQAEFHRWIHDNTTLNDRFYLYEDIYYPDYDDRIQMLNDRLIFTTYTGRYAIGWGNFTNPLGTQYDDLRAIMEKCDVAAFKDLGIKYVVLPREEVHAKWFTSHCKTRDWNLVRESVQDKNFLKLYELKSF
jgi:hypothetical protein